MDNISEISEYDVKYIKLCIHNGTSLEELISYLEDLNREKDYRLIVSEMVYLKLEEKEE